MLGGVTSNPLGWFFPWLWVVSLHECADKCSDEYLRGFFIAVKVLSLCYSPAFGMLSYEVSCFGFTELPVFISSIQGICWTLLGSSSWCHGLKTVSRIEQSYHSPHLFCFQGIAVLCCLIFSALQTGVSYVLSMLYCFRWDGSLFPITLSWLEVGEFLNNYSQ